MSDNRRHPAPFSPAVLTVIQRTLDERGVPGGKVLDPFAGIGGIHRLTGYKTVGVEIEPEWAEKHPDTEVGDATNMRFRKGSFGAIVTSPCYGNRMADHHKAKDSSARHTYRHRLGRPLTEGSAGALQWGEEYRQLHYRAVLEATRVARKDALFVLNMSDHIRQLRIMPVTAWWIGQLTECGWAWVDAEPVKTPRQRNGANADLRMENEWVLTFTRLPEKK